MLTGFNKMLAAFYKDDVGATAIEYGLIMALVSTVIVVGISNFGGSMTSMYNYVSSTTDTAVSNLP